MKKFDLKKLSVAVALLVGSVFAPTLTQASDIEIYKEAQAGNTTLMFMLDISASMSAIVYTPPGSTEPLADNAISACDLPYTNLNQAEVKKSRTYAKVEAAMANGPEYRRQWCEYNNTKYYDRITKLKDGMISLLLGNPEKNIEKLDDSKVIGLSTLGSNDNYLGTYSAFTPTPFYGTGRILVPARKLSDTVTYKNKTMTQRELLVEKMREMEAYEATPTARSYAETIAYLMGQTTKNSYSVQNVTEEKRFIMKDGSWYFYVDCTASEPTGKCQAYSSQWSKPYTNLEDAKLAGSVQGRADKVGLYSGHWYTISIPNKTVEVNNGFDKSAREAKSENRYISPSSLSQTDADKGCNAQGIYVLTDGRPTSDYYSDVLLRKSVGLSELDTKFSCDGSSFGCAHTMAKILRDKDNPLNPKKLAIKTAVVGFGTEFRPKGDVKSYNPDLTEQENLANVQGITDSEVRRAAEWGIYGKGGWYSGERAEDVVDSVNKFLANLATDIPELTTGSPTIPIDSLNRFMILNDAYYASFSPKPESPEQLWLGNMSKYYVKDGILVGLGKQSATSAETMLPIFKADKTLVNNKDPLTPGLKEPYPYVLDFWRGGTLKKLFVNASGAGNSDRVIYTNRFVSNGTATARPKELQLVNVESLYNNSKLGTDTGRNYWLNLLGFDVDVTSNLARTQLPAVSEKLRKLGATMHSKPVVLTQEGQSIYTTELNLYETYNGKTDSEITAALRASGITDSAELSKQLAKIKKSISSVDAKLKTRKGYVMYGSTQGLLHIVDSATGREKFSFVPNELFEKQKEGFLAQSVATGGKENLFYGVDAPWTEFSQYVAVAGKPNLLTVKDSTLDTTKDEIDITDKGLQWIYGGLRMGGRSYYALDISNIDSPKLKFQINPDAQTSGPLSFMGESWSKPTLSFVKWNGKSKLVMFVGGGYDRGYEKSNYAQTNGKGAGVYMFDAHNGKLLWWASNNEASQSGVEFKKHSDLKYSVVSQINAIDTDNDGFVDNLYFGDLGGQAFRVDLDNSAQSTSNFAKRVVTLFKAGGTVAPRFYETPSLTVHRDATAGLFMVTAWNSGDRSSPMAGPNHATNKVTAQDGTFVMYDMDILREDLLTSDVMQSGSATQTFATLNELTGTPVVANGKYNLGWKYTYPSTNGQYKGIERIYALKGLLYANVFDRDGDGVGGECGAGVKGNTLLYEYCLPTGKCTVEEHGRVGSGDGSTPRNQPISGGINAIDTIGNKDTNNNVGLVGSNIQPCPANSTDIRCRKVARVPGIGIVRWYES